jgi:2-polyprenyl-6-methoxyphenol hydroxylase-like FAD-dependent oxidoreductase
MQTETDVLIIGAGPAGSISAALLRRDGFRVTMVEKSRFPRFVIGESLLPQSMQLLEEAGLLDPIASQGFMKKYGAVFFRDGKTCNFDFAQQFTPGWKYTYQVPRAEFDKTLADTVAARGVEVLFGHEVAAVNFEAARVTTTVLPGDGTRREITSRFVLDCSGYGRVLPRLLQLERPSTLAPREALFSHVTGDHRPEGREEGKVWICILPGDAWIWVIPFSDGRTSVGVVGDPAFFARFPSDPEERLRAILLSEPSSAERLTGMKFVFPPQRLAAYSCAVKQVWGPGYALVGNATEFLDPIFSSGVALAIASAHRVAAVLARELRGEPVNWQAEYADFVMQGINTFRTYVSAWYDGTLPNIFFAARANPGIMRQVCSVLAGYVWDTANPYVSQPARALPLLSRIVQGQSASP